MLFLFAAIALLSLYTFYRWIELQLFALTWDIESTIAAADETRDIESTIAAADATRDT